MIVIDAAVAVKWILKEEDSDRALALYTATIAADEVIAAPPLLPLEVTNVIRQRMRVPDGLSLEEATELLDEFFMFRVTTYNPLGLHHQALVLAASLGLPATYDAHYIALAQRLRCDLWTDDRRLLRVNLPFVRRIGEYIQPGV